MSKINLKSVLKAIDCRQTDWYNNLTVEEQNEVSVWQLMRFTSSCNSNIPEIIYHYLVMTNELVNTNFNILKNEPELQFRLLQTVGIGTTQFHPWIKPAKKEKADKLFEYMKNHFKELNDDEIEILLSQDKKMIIDYLTENGLTETEISEIIK